MRNLFFLLLLAPTILLAQSKGFVVSGTVTGLSEGAAVKITKVQGDSLVAKSTVKNGAFSIKGTVPEPGLYFIVLGTEQPQHIYLENAAIKISGDKKDIKNIKIEGSQSNNDFEDFKRIFNPLVGELNAVAAQINQAQTEEKRNSLMHSYDSINKKIDGEVETFVAAKQSSYVSPFLLYLTAQILDNPLIIERRYNSLDATVRNSIIGKSLADYIAYNKVGAVGSDEIDFTQNDVNGKPVSLSSFKGKYVLVDFWASWCKPCRMENPNVVKAYQKFNAKNFTILSVSLDKEKDPWLRAIQTDNLVWTHVSDLKFWNNEAAVLYHVQGIPQNFLIDPSGKIVAKNLRSEELNAKLCELLGCN